MGIQIAQAHPDDYHAYVGVSQFVDPRQGQEIAHAWLSQEIAAAENQGDARRLAVLGPPPFTAHDRYVQFANLVEAYGGNFDIGMGELAWVALPAPEYRLTDWAAWFRGANWGSGPMWESSQSFDAFRDVPELHLPVYFCNGSHDYNTPLPLLEIYFQQLEAPHGKQLVPFERSAHTPFLGQPQAFNRAPVRVKEDTYRPRDAYSREIPAGYIAALSPVLPAGMMVSQGQFDANRGGEREIRDPTQSQPPGTQRLP